MNLILTLLLIPLVSSSLYVFVALRRRPTPFQQIFIDAEARIRDHGLCRGNFTPLGYRGIGQNLAHDLTSTVAVCDPDYQPPQTMYQLESVVHLRMIAYTDFGMSPEDIGDQLELEQALELLHKARTTPKAIEG